MKRILEEEVVFPITIPDEVLVVVFHEAFRRFETHPMDYRLLNQMRTVSNGTNNVVEGLMRSAREIPYIIEALVEKPKHLWKKHPNLEIISHWHRFSEHLTGFKNLRFFTYTGGESTDLTKYPIHTESIHTIVISNDSICRVPNLSVLVNMVKTITTLKLSYGTPIGKSVLKMFTNLTSLTMDYNDNCSDDVIQHLTGLISLSVKGTPPLTNNAFIYASKLRDLDITSNSMVTDRALLHLSGLVNLTTNSIITNDGLSRLTNLEKLSIPTYSTLNSALRLLTNLRTLQFFHDLSDADLSPLSDSLTSLDLSYVSSLVTNDSLTRLTNLKILTLQNHSFVRPSGFITSEGLSKMTGLTKLRLRGNREVRDEWITSLTNLTELDIFNTGITDASLTRLSNLRHILLPIDISSIDIDELSKLHKLTDITLSSYSDYGPKSFPPHIYVHQR